MIVTEGGLEGGFGLYLRDGKPTFVYNFLDVDRPTIAAKEPLPKGKTKLIVTSLRRGWTGKGGRHHAANGNKIAEGRLERTVPSEFADSAKGDSTSAWTRLGGEVHLKLPFKFTGTIQKVEIDLAATK